MATAGNYTFKIATEAAEFEQIHRLNYRTFVEEIPQHAANEGRRLVDRFDEENTYVVCLEGGRLVGMMSVRDRRPFSLDTKLPNLDDYLPSGRRACEFRLLSVELEHRNGQIFHGLLKLMAEHCFARGYDLAVISGTLGQSRLYRHLGFVPFGPVVGTAEAPYQPMYLTRAAFLERSKTFLRRNAREADRVNLLPGPVGIRAEVREAFAAPPASHRGGAFVECLESVRRRLVALTGARGVQVLLGSGTLANDAVAAQLSLEASPGLILANGEFGERLLDHAERFQLDFEAVRLEWGGVFDGGLVEDALSRRPGIRWLWAVHCETSTGVLNDLRMLADLCAVRGLRLCLDAISSIGTVPVDLGGVYLASAVSGKGLGSFPGLSMVFHNHPLEPAPARLPRYLDLGLYAAQPGVPFTQSSNLVSALDIALDRFGGGAPFREMAEVSSWLRPRIREMGWTIVAPDEHASPAVITIGLPGVVESADLGARLEKDGYLISYRSEYLLRRNWIQVCLMGEVQRTSLIALLAVLRDHGLPVLAGQSMVG